MCTTAISEAVASCPLSHAHWNRKLLPLSDTAPCKRCGFLYRRLTGQAQQGAGYYPDFCSARAQSYTHFHASPQYIIKLPSLWGPAFLVGTSAALPAFTSACVRMRERSLFQGSRARLCVAFVFVSDEPPSWLELRSVETVGARTVSQLCSCGRPSG